MANQKSLLKYAILGVLVFVMAGYVLRSCNLYDENSKLKGIIKTQETLLQQQEERTKIAKEAYEKVLSEQGSEIEHWKEVAAKKTEGMAIGDAKIRELKERLAKLDPAEKDAIISTQNDVIHALEDNLTMAYETIAAKNKIIDAWEVKFLAWEGYKFELESENTKLHGLVDTQKSLIAGLEKELRLSRIGGKTKNILLAGAAGYLVYSAVKK